MASTARLSLLSWHLFDSLLRGKLLPYDRVRLLVSWLAWQSVCAAVFGLSLGVYALTSRPDPDVRFMAASFVKMPLLLFLTSVVTCPSLYVFGALRGLRFSAREFAAMLMVAHTILAAVLGSLAPVIAFFALTTTSYSFMVLLTVLACGVAGLLGIRVFVKAINEPPPPDNAAEGAGSTQEPEAGTAGQASSGTRSGVNATIWRLLGWWVVLYAFVGAQMGWMLRPFIGAPDLPFILFRGKSGSFIEGVLHHIQHVFGG
ncbi:MAG: hypothetical protein NTW87_35550 [Planctomycetota bacterium]|nr:hypothetical protein [Planctomycetota bacterium]